MVGRWWPWGEGWKSLGLVKTGSGASSRSHVRTAADDAAEAADVDVKSVLAVFRSVTVVVTVAVAVNVSSTVVSVLKAGAGGGGCVVADDDDNHEATGGCGDDGGGDGDDVAHVTDATVGDRHAPSSGTAWRSCSSSVCASSSHRSSHARPCRSTAGRASAAAWARACPRSA